MFDKGNLKFILIWPISILISLFLKLLGYFNSDIDVTATFYKPIFEGYINAVDSSFDVPYLGLRYGFVDDPTFTLNNQTINIKDFTLNEKKSNTSGIMSGKISHNRLKDWFLDFKIESKNLLALNTKSSENEYYYGTGFLNGSAYFIGPGKDLDIEMAKVYYNNLDDKIRNTQTGNNIYNLMNVSKKIISFMKCF